MLYLSTLLKSAPLPLNQYARGLRESAAALAVARNLLFVYRMDAARLMSTPLARRASLDIYASHQKFGDLTATYHILRGSLALVTRASSSNALVRRSTVLSHFAIETLHDINGARDLDYELRVAQHAKMETRRWLYESFSRKVYRVLAEVKSINQESRGQFALHFETPGDKNPPNRIATETLNMQRQWRAVEREMNKMELEESLQEAMIVMSRRFKATADLDLPQLVSWARDDSRTS